MSSYNLLEDRSHLSSTSPQFELYKSYIENHPELICSSSNVSPTLLKQVCCQERIFMMDLKHFEYHFRETKPRIVYFSIISVTELKQKLKTQGFSCLSGQEQTAAFVINK